MGLGGSGSGERRTEGPGQEEAVGQEAGWRRGGVQDVASGRELMGKERESARPEEQGAAAAAPGLPGEDRQRGPEQERAAGGAGRCRALR